MNPIAIGIIIAQNIGLYFLIDWYVKRNLPKPEINQRLINLSARPFGRFLCSSMFYFGVYCLSKTLFLPLSLQYVALNIIILFIVLLTGYYSLSFYYILYDDERIKMKKGLFKKEQCIYWNTIVDLKFPKGVYSTEDQYTVITDPTSEKTFQYVLLIGGKRLFEETTQKDLDEFHRKILAIVALYKTKHLKNNP